MRFRSPLTVIKHEGGNVALIAALCMLPLAMLVGMSIDLSNATRVRLALQDATDSAALAMARNLSSIPKGGEAAAAKNYIDASYEKAAPFTVSSATIEADTLTVVINSKAEVPTTFAGLLGKTAIPVAARAVVQGKGVDYEIALVVDNSGSMTSTAGAGSSKISELRAAALVLLNELNVTSGSDRVKVSIVPFASAVKVGAGFADEDWIDSDGVAPKASENFDTPVSRFDLFDEMDVNWAGCVESREIVVSGQTVDYDINDALPSNGDKSTLFIPWFAPDEPDGDSNQTNGYYSNSYLDDEGGDCRGSAKRNVSDTEKQERVCKYHDGDLKMSGGKGPNFQCTTTPITPLTNTRKTLEDAIKALQANGNTNVSEGLAWGWRTLSPTAPFTQGRPYATKDLQKIVILMTDGMNNIPGANNTNRSVYSSYAYMKHERLGTKSNNSGTIRDKMDDRTAKACELVKSAGILIYTVALGPEADAAGLRTCASGPASEYASAPKTGAELTPTFKRIAASINKLRLAQ